MAECGLPIPCESSVSAPEQAALSITNQGTDGTAIRAHAPVGFGTGVQAESIGGPGVVASSTSGSGLTATSVSSNGVRAQSGTGNGIIAGSVDGVGVVGNSENGDGVIGTSKFGQGVIGQSKGEEGGVFPIGVLGVCNTSAGVFGTGVTGVFGVGLTPDIATPRFGVLGRTTGRGAGVRGEGFSGTGFVSVGAEGIAAAIHAGATINVGTRGFARNSKSLNTGMVARASRGPEGSGAEVIGLHASANGGFAGYFEGAVYVTGAIFKAGGGFKIDHPLDPSNKYLSHSFVESSEMKNVYDGVAALDDNGERTVEIPRWVEALNSDFRYQLTSIGGPAPDLHVSQEIANSRFKIAGGTAGMKVSWQVTGIRRDAWAKRNPLAVEEDKPSNQRGYHLHPDLYGQPPENSTLWKGNAELLRQVEEPQEDLPETEKLMDKVNYLRGKMNQHKGQ